MLIERKRRIDAGIDMTPLIDVVFQLLIFLLVSSQFIKPDQKVDLPTGPVSSAPITAEKKALVLVIEANDKLLLEGRELKTEQLPERLRSSISETGLRALEIRGDREANLGTFITVIETAREHGITALGYHKKENDKK